jgi:protein SCO1/2
MTAVRMTLALTAPLCLLAVACEARRAPSAGAPEAGGESAAREYPNPRPKPDFTLTDTEGRPFAFRQATAGSVTLLFFGYTNCPDVCPVHMANIASALHKLPDAVARQVTVVFITTDPERDTPARIRAWLDHFDPRFIGLTGSQAAVDSAQVAMHLPPAYKEDLGGGQYQVGHSAHVIAFTRDGLARFAFPFGTRQSEWAQEIPRLVAYPDQP